MVWFGGCSKGLSPLVIFQNGTVDYNRYINEVLPVTPKYGNSIFGNDWTFQQDGTKSYFHEKTQEWCANNFPFVHLERSLASKQSSIGLLPLE